MADSSRSTDPVFERKSLAHFLERKMGKKSAHIVFSLLAIAIGLVLSFAVLGILELGVRLAQRAGFMMNPSSAESIFIKGDFYEQFWKFDADLGYKPPPGAIVQSTKQNMGGEVIYHASYSTDKWGRRFTPVDDPALRDRCAVFFGCSFTFGDGLNDDETLPYFFAKFASRYNPYNYSFSGYGPQNMLARIEQGGLVEEIPERCGVMICVGAHVERAIGAYYVFNEWGQNFPYYFIDNKGDLVRNGSFSTGRPIMSVLFSFMAKSRLVKLSGFRYPWHITDQDRELTARIIKESFLKFQKQFPGVECYFVNPPGLENAEDRNDRNSFKGVSQILEKEGIKVLDFSSIKEFQDEKYYIKGDRHPMPIWNRELAKLIVERLGIASNE